MIKRSSIQTRNGPASFGVTPAGGGLASTPAYRFVLFARNFFRHPKSLGSIWPSSRFLIRRTLDHVDWERARVIVEYGPGIGNFTAAILERMRPDARLVAIEINPEFVRYLQRVGRDGRLQVVCGSAANVADILREVGLRDASYVISGIPFSTLPAKTRTGVLTATRSVLGERGAMLVYQFSRSVLPDLQATFREVRCEFEPRNLLPAVLFRCSG